MQLVKWNAYIAFAGDAKFYSHGVVCISLKRKLKKPFSAYSTTYEDSSQMLIKEEKSQIYMKIHSYLNYFTLVDRNENWLKQINFDGYSLKR